MLGAQLPWWRSRIGTATLGRPTGHLGYGDQQSWRTPPADTQYCVLELATRHYGVAELPSQQCLGASAQARDWA